MELLSLLYSCASYTMSYVHANDWLLTSIDLAFQIHLKSNEPALLVHMYTIPCAYHAVLSCNWLLTISWQSQIWPGKLKIIQGQTCSDIKGSLLYLFQCSEACHTPFHEDGTCFDLQCHWKSNLSANVVCSLPIVRFSVIYTDLLTIWVH